ncbi:hypothetical protein N9V90_00605 [Endozoicomonas sp.]|nr:hypothetical protein [Endozoicomonas sp.]
MNEDRVPNREVILGLLLSPTPCGELFDTPANSSCVEKTYAEKRAPSTLRSNQSKKPKQSSFFQQFSATPEQGEKLLQTFPSLAIPSVTTEQRLPHPANNNSAHAIPTEKEASSVVSSVRRSQQKQDKRKKEKESLCGTNTARDTAEFWKRTIQREVLEKEQAQNPRQHFMATKQAPPEPLEWPALMGKKSSRANEEHTVAPSLPDNNE